MIFDIRELSNAAVAEVGVLKVRHQDWPEQRFGYHDDKAVLAISFYLWRKSVEWQIAIGNNSEAVY